MDRTRRCFILSIVLINVIAAIRIIRTRIEKRTDHIKGIPIQCPHEDCGYKWSYGERFFIYAKSIIFSDFISFYFRYDFSNNRRLFRAILTFIFGT